MGVLGNASLVADMTVRVDRRCPCVAALTAPTAMMMMTDRLLQGTGAVSSEHAQEKEEPSQFASRTGRPSVTKVDRCVRC